MTTSFYNGVSGLKSFQNGIDTWGENIANINTAAYKQNIPEFSTLFSNTLNTNPVTSDIGQGSSFTSSAKDFSEGSLVKSDNSFDMAIVGDAFFKVDNLYTKNGQFNLDADGYLVDGNGHYLQGNMLYKGDSQVVDKNLIIDKNYNKFDDNSILQNKTSKIKLPPNLLAPAKKTKNMSLQADLSNKMKEPIPSEENSSLGAAYIKQNNNYIPTNLKNGDKIVAGFGNFTIDQNLVYTDIPIKNQTIPLNIDTTINGQNIKLSFTNPNTTDEDIKQAISDKLNQLNIKNELTKDGIRVCGYNELIINSNDNLFQNVAAERIEYSTNPSKKNEFHTNEDLTNILNNLSQTVNPNTNITFKDGHFIFSNNSNANSKLTFKPLSATLNNFTSIFPKTINSNTTTKTPELYLNKQKFNGYEYDENGEKHNLTFSFIKKDNNQFLLNILDENNNTLSSKELTYENGKFTPNKITFDNTNLTLDLALQNTVTSTIFSQDGFSKGELNKYEIDNNGTILAYFNNNKEAVLGKIPIFHFQNSQGLEALGGSLFTQSPNSGDMLIANKDFASIQQDPIKNKLVKNKIAYIKSGYLENSNVKMQEAMTELIITQKAFNASAKTITTSDEMIQKAINLKR